MNKLNKKFNSRIKRLSKWQEVKTRLSDFEGLVNSYDGLSPHEVQDIKLIHRKLYEAYSIAKKHEQEVRNEIQRHRKTMEQSH